MLPGRFPFLCALVLLASSCTSGRAFRTFAHFTAEQRFELGSSEPAPEIDALAERFYADTIDPAALRAEIDAALERHPRSATLHEMAALLAELGGDDAGAWAHWLMAASDRETPFTSIYLHRAFAHDLTVRQTTASIALLEALVRSHPRPDVRVDAARRLIALYESRERFAEADALSRELGFIDRWNLIGAFDNDQGRGLLATYPPEESIDLDAEVRGLLLPVRWRDDVLLDRGGMVRIGDQISPDRWAVAYLLTHVHADEARDVQLRLTTGDGLRVWVNGALVVDQERVARAATDNIVVPVRLERGWNRLLAKSAHDDAGAWIFGARITDSEGRPIPSLRYEAALREVPNVEAGELPPNESPLAGALGSVTPELRRLLLTHHDSVRNGFEGDALANARRLLEAAPEHPVVIYAAALTHWTNDELGRTMDLLNEGVRRFPELAGFHRQRGAFYRQRQRYDRAIEDLRRAVELNPDARLARMELAGAFEDRGFREHEHEVLAAVIERWPDSGWALRALGDSEQARGYLDRAEEKYLRADALEPGHAWNLERLATLARWRHDFASAIRFAERLRALAPWSVDSLVTLADHLRYAGRREEARALYREAAARDRAWARPHHWLGVMAFEDGDAAGALAAWTAALARDPDNGALADRVDFLRQGEDDPERRLMPSDEAIQAALARRVEIHPGAHTVLILDDEVTTVQQDGSAMRRVTQVHLAVTTDGRDELIAFGVPTNARILQAYSVSPNGAHQEASSIRGGTIRFRGLEVGSRVVVQYVYHDPPPAFLPNHFVSSWLFQGIHRQLVEARWVVQVPRGRRLAVHVQGPVEHRVSQRGPYDQHVFTASNVPPLVPEPAMPPARDLLATVTLSTLTDWREYVEWERALLSEVFVSNAQLRALAARLTEGASTPRERLERIYHYVAQEIRYQQDYETTIAGVRPHSCPVVLERGYGDCKDKAVLMILLGREVGLDLRFAVLRTTNAGRVLREVPNQQFNHAIVYVPAQEGIEAGFFMDPTTDGLDMGNLRDDDQGALALVLDPRDGGWEFTPIPYQGPEMSYLRCAVDVRVASAEEATAQARCSVRGAAGSMMRRLARNEERARQLHQNVANTIFNGATVRGASMRNTDDIWRPVELELELDASAALQPQGGHHRLPVPSSFGLGGLTRLESRRTPLRLGVPDSSRWEVTYELPARGRIVRTPEDFEIEHRCFSVSRRTVTRGRRATVTVEYRRTCPEIAPEEYAEVRRLAQRAVNQLQSEIVLDL